MSTDKKKRRIKMLKPPKSRATRSRISLRKSQEIPEPRVEYVEGSELNYEQVVKLILIGDSGVGKTSLMSRFATEDFDHDQPYVTTIGVDFRTRLVRFRNRAIKIQMWDTAGQERFHNINAPYYKSANGVIVVYDCSHDLDHNVQRVKQWIHSVNMYNPNAFIVVTGNKSDKFVVDNETSGSTDSDSNPLTSSNEYPHVYVSAHTGSGFQELLVRCLMLTTANHPKTSKTSPNKSNQSSSVTEQSQSPQSVSPKKKKRKNQLKLNCLRRPKKMFEHQIGDEAEAIATVRLNGGKAKVRVTSSDDDEMTSAYINGVKRLSQADVLEQIVNRERKKSEQKHKCSIM